MPAELHTTLTPDTPVRYLKGVGPKTAERFEKLGILTLSDLLCHYPRRYLDFSKPYSIAEAPADTECVVKAEVFAKPGGRILPGGRRMERITAGDDVSSLEITWFNNPYAAQKLELGQEYYFQGIVTGGMLRRQMVNPQVRTDAQVKSSPFEAVYPQTEGLTSSAIAKCVRQLLPHAELLPDPLPSEMLKKYRLLSKADAVRAIHCPATEEEAFAARRRLIYEELLVLQLGIGRMKNHGAASTGAPMKKADASPFWESLPFSPTGAQQRAVEEILTDMSGETSMNRLLQGDVGSGKTLVAAAAIWACIRAGYQAALLAPTEILASQHAENLNRLLSPFGMRVALLTGGMKAAAKRTTLAAIRAEWVAKRQELERKNIAKKNLRRLLQLARKHEAEALAKARLEFQGPRNAVRRDIPFTSWNGFLQQKADQGSEVALAVLRSRKEAVEPEQAAPVKDWSQHGQARAEFAAKERAVLEKDGISGKAKSRLQSVLRMEQIVDDFRHYVDRKGAVVFTLQDGSTVRDSGKDVLFSAASDSARLTAMLYAKKKWGKQVVLEGSRIIRSPHDRKQKQERARQGHSL